MARWTREDYMGDTVALARKLIGQYLVRHYRGELLVCRITETEAYVGAIDKACHAYGYHKTKRNATMFGPAGHAYIYLIYGMHACLNFVTNAEGEPDAVLLRGLEPIYGQDTLCRLRYGKPWNELTAYQRKNFLNGPGKCCKALSLDTSLDGLDLEGDELFICSSPADVDISVELPPPYTVATGKRIGIDYAEEAVDFPWRFTLQEIKGGKLC
ncbi:MAG: DNA-3-methyladenine glycosylase [Oscillospiraceae bacterium]|nr:DNA-3-methyladenine glycosylase [Oscillospiraceae bacterium]